MTHLLTLLVAFTAAPPSRSGEIELVVPGVVPRELAPRDGARMFALCEDGPKWVQVSLREVDAAHVQVMAPCRTPALLDRLPQQAPAHVQTARVRRVVGRVVASPSGPAKVLLELGGHKAFVERVRVSSSGYRLLFHPEQGGEVVLYDCQSTDEARWSLLWAGDLDGDGQLDLLIDASDAFDVSEVRLFLSRDADEGLDEAAWLRRPRQSIRAR